MFKNIQHTSLLLLCFFLKIALGNGQTFIANLNSNSIVLGERASLTISLKLEPGSKIVTWPNYSDTFNHIEIIKRGKIDSFVNGNAIQLVQVIELTSFDSGSWVIPAVPYVVDTIHSNTDSLFLSVRSIPLKGDTYNDIKEIIEVPAPGINWLFWIAVVGSIILLSVLIYLWWRSRKKKPVIAKSKSTEPPFELAMKQLQQLKEANLPLKGEIKKYYILLYDIYRNYLSTTTGMKILQSSTDDILIKIRHMMQAVEFSSISSVLRISEAVKFAKYKSSVDEANESIEIVSTSIILLNKLKP
jgi:hypothetical protein